MLHAFARRAAVVPAILAIIATAGCTLHNTETPALSGPSGFALTLNVIATPDTLSFGINGPGDESLITITAIGPDGKPVSRQLPIRVAMRVNGVVIDYGTLDAGTIFTKDGVASVKYTAPSGPPNGLFDTCHSLPGTCVTIVATPIGTNFETSNTEGVTIRIAPPFVPAPVPTPGSPTAVFDVSPPGTVKVNQSVTFNASRSSAGPGRSLVRFDWDFGDNVKKTGVTTTHDYGTASDYAVILTVTDDLGQKTSSGPTRVTVVP